MPPRFKRRPAFVFAAVGVCGVLGCGGVTSAPVEEKAKPPVESTAKPKTDAVDAQKKALLDYLRSTFKPLPAGWVRFDVQELRLVKHGRVAVDVIYSRQPSGYPAVESDTTKVVRAVLAWIQSCNVDPAGNDLTVSSSALLPESGETGKKLVRFMGKSRYLGITDRIEFQKKLF